MKEKTRKSNNWYQRITSTLIMIFTVSIVGWLLNSSRYGFDFTDEGYYLVWMASPKNYSWSVSQFGFIYHPLYQLVDGNVVALRQANILITFSLALGLFLALFEGISIELMTFRDRLIGAGGLAISSLLLLATWWLPTPNYNSLTLQALLIGATGLLLMEHQIYRARVIGAVLIGVAGWLTFTSKPSTAVMFSICCGSYFLLAGKNKLKLIWVPVGVAITLVVITALLIDGSIIEFYERLKIGFEYSKLSGAGYSIQSILRLDEYVLDNRDQKILIFVGVATYINILLLGSKRKILEFLGFMFTFTIFSAAILFLSIEFARAKELNKFGGLIIWAIPFAAMVSCLTILKWKILKAISAPYFLLAMIFFSFPHVYAFGTNGNYWHAGTAASIFWVLGGVILVVPIIQFRTKWMLILPLVLATQIVSLLLLQKSMDFPYRQPYPLHLNNYAINIPQSNSTILVSKEYSRYINRAQDLSKLAGFKMDMPIIDLTGQSPGLLYLLGATNVGYPWISGGYPGSEAVAYEGLRLVSCELLSTSWILTEVDGPRKVSTNVLHNFGLDISKNYTLAAEWHTAVGAGGYEYSRHQQLFKPIKNDNVEIRNCGGLRSVK